MAEKLDREERKYRLDAFETLVAEGVKLKADLDEWKRRADAAPVWISVKDRLPNPGERVLATDGAFVGTAFTRANGWMRYEGIDWQVISSSRVTHWMPLPEPPKEAHHEKA